MISSLAHCKDVNAVCSWTQPTTNHIDPFACYIRIPFELHENDSLNITSEIDANEIMEVNFWLPPSSRQHWNIEFIPKIIFERFPQLERFILPGRIQSIHPTDFKSAVHTKRMQLGYQIKSLPANVFIRMGALELLDLTANRISYIHENAFNGLSALRTLKLSRNQLKRIKTQTFHGTPALDELHLNNNHIDYINSNALNLPQLKRLDLSYNRLNELTDETFRLCSQLEWLDLKSNRLKRIKYSIYTLQHLQHVNLDHNKIDDIKMCAFARLPRLEHLSIENNGRTLNDSIFISDKPPYGSQSPIRNLYLSGNALKHREILLHLWSLGVTQLEQLHIDNNEFEHINFYPIAAFAKLKEIDLGLNRWKCDWLEQTIEKLETDGIDLNLYSSHFPATESNQHVNFIQCT